MQNLQHELYLIFIRTKTHFKQNLFLFFVITQAYRTTFTIYFYITYACCLACVVEFCFNFFQIFYYSNFTLEKNTFILLLFFGNLKTCILINDFSYLIPITFQEPSNSILYCTICYTRWFFKHTQVYIVFRIILKWYK